MQIVDQGHKIWGRCPSNPLEAIRWIERAGRVCYNSENKITDDSAEPFVRKLIERGHLSVLEHSFCSVSRKDSDTFSPTSYFDFVPDGLCGNLRGMIEATLVERHPIGVFNKWLSGEYIPAKHIGEFRVRYTVEFTTNRAMTHELVRHRPASYSQESQRYVRYDNMKFIKPVGYDEWPEKAQDRFRASCIEDEAHYDWFLNHFKLKPQQARNVLPNATATRIVVTADRWEWEDIIFKLRCGGGADPQMINLMTPVRDEMHALWETEK